jgi:hypothetical protein
VGFQLLEVYEEAREEIGGLLPWVLFLPLAVFILVQELSQRPVVGHARRAAKGEGVLLSIPISISARK